MSTLDDLIAQIPLDQLARRLGVDEQEAEQLTRRALPALVGGMEANAQDPGGAASLAAALREHDDELLDGGVDLDQVDPDDGEKIVGHVFGDQRDEVVNQLGGLGGSGGGMIGKLLPLLAPLVMSFLAKRMGGGGSTAGGGTGSATEGGGGLADIFGGLLGGDGQDGGGLGGLGDILGGLLGGGRKQ